MFHLIALLEHMTALLKHMTAILECIDLFVIDVVNMYIPA